MILWIVFAFLLIVVFVAVHYHEKIFEALHESEKLMNPKMNPILKGFIFVIGVTIGIIMAIFNLGGDDDD